MRRAEPAEAVRLDPLRIVERADTHAAHAGQRLDGPGDLRAALRTELEAQPAAAFVRMVLIGGEPSLQQVKLLGVEVSAEAEGAAGAPLAAGAVADRRARRLALQAIAHRA